MKYQFGRYSLDPERFDLTENGQLVSIEPQVFTLLKLLVENQDRLISKDEIIAAVWNNKIASDASIANRIKLARSAIGDDGSTQKYIRTIHGQGFRFVGDAKIVGVGTVSANTRLKLSEIELSDAPIRETKGGKPSIAVLPFQYLGPADPKFILTEAIPHDLIQALSRLRWMFVIARGSAFRFRSTDDKPQDVGRALRVRYVLVGSIENHGPELVITTELCDTNTGAAIWGERFNAKPDDIHEIRAEIVAKVIASLEVYIPLNEAMEARVRVSENLDAWSNYHLGLQHMYRFTERDNAAAVRFFHQATEQDAGFARAHAGLSFTSFQEAFLRYGGDQKNALLSAHRFAQRSVELDPLDPFANFNMGRALMLQGDLAASSNWLDKAITLSPSYSQGHYSHAFSNMLSGKTADSQQHFDKALSLSPLDPFAYAMMAGRSLSFAIDGDFQRAAEMGEKAARAPGAHYIVDMIALIGHALNSDDERARAWADKVRQRRPDANSSLFFESLPFSNPGITEKLSGALAQFGF